MSGSLDTYEVLLAGTLSTTLQKQFLLTEDPVKAVLASAFVGQFLGALVLGRLADRVGRRRMFLGFFQAAGIPTVICGPGSISQAHQPDEWIAADQLQHGYRFLSEAARWARSRANLNGRFR